VGSLDALEPALSELGVDGSTAVFRLEDGGADRLHDLLSRLLGRRGPGDPVVALMPVLHAPAVGSEGVSAACAAYDQVHAAMEGAIARCAGAPGMRGVEQRRVPVVPWVFCADALDESLAERLWRRVAGQVPVPIVHMAWDERGARRSAEVHGRGRLLAELAWVEALSADSAELARAFGASAAGRARHFLDVHSAWLRVPFREQVRSEALRIVVDPTDGLPDLGGATTEERAREWRRDTEPEWSRVREALEAVAPARAPEPPSPDDVAERGEVRDALLALTGAGALDPREDASRWPLVLRPSLHRRAEALARELLTRSEDRIHTQSGAALDQAHDAADRLLEVLEGAVQGALATEEPVGDRVGHALTLLQRVQDAISERTRSRSLAQGEGTDPVRAALEAMVPRWIEAERRLLEAADRVPSGVAAFAEGLSGAAALGGLAALVAWFLGEQGFAAGLAQTFGAAGVGGLAGGAAGWIFRRAPARAFAARWEAEVTAPARADLLGIAVQIEAIVRHRVDEARLSVLQRVMRRVRAARRRLDVEMHGIRHLVTQRQAALEQERRARWLRPAPAPDREAAVWSLDTGAAPSQAAHGVLSGCIGRLARAASLREVHEAEPIDALEALLDAHAEAGAHTPSALDRQALTAAVSWALIEGADAQRLSRRSSAEANMEVRTMVACGSWLTDVVGAEASPHVEVLSAAAAPPPDTLIVVSLRERQVTVAPPEPVEVE
jgi:hypothetical protein